MNIFCVDAQLVGESSAQIFELLQQSPIAAQVFLTNTGTNTINYRFQKLGSDGSWTDIGAQGSDYYNTLTAGQTKAISLSESSVRIKMLANASGGSAINFAVSRFHNRSAGAALPVLVL